MKNAEISELFSEMADIMEILGEDVFRINSYRRVARVTGDGETGGDAGDWEIVVGEDRGVYKDGENYGASGTTQEDTEDVVRVIRDTGDGAEGGKGGL
jgi:hypothetical protein